MDERSRPRFRLDCSDERLWDSGNPVPLTRKAFELLRLLAGNPNRLLTKDEIRENLWRGVHVTESLIKEYVHDLRLALGDDPRHPEFIQTVRGRGYRFIGELQVSGRCSPDLPDVSGADRPSIAVLPLDNLTGEERWLYFCHGIADDLITDLARLPGIAVSTRAPIIPPDCVAAGPSNIGRSVGARYVLRGSLQPARDKLRVNLHLLRSEDGLTLWTDRYEFEGRHSVVAHGELLARVVSALEAVDGPIFKEEARRLDSRPVEDLTAHELYLLGFHLEEKHDRKSVLRAFDLLQRAVRLDPEIAKAWVALGWCCYQISHERWAPHPLIFADMIREAHLQAWRIDSNDPLVVMNASIRVNQGDLAALCEAYERAADLGSDRAELLAEAAKYIAMTVDDADRALQLLSRSIELKPQASAAHLMHKVRAAYSAGDYDGALAAAMRAPEMKLVRVFELLSLAQMDRRSELLERRAAFATKYPDFRLCEFMRDQPIMRSRAKARFMEGAEKACLQ